MNLDFSQDQELVRKSAKEFLVKQYNTTISREIEDDPNGYNANLWKKIAELGWLGLIIPEKYGGNAAPEESFIELCIVLEEMGRAYFLSPFFSTAISSLLLLDAGNEKQKEFFLPKITEGKLIFTVALTEPSASYEASGITTKAQLNKDNYIVNGTKLFVHDAQIADYLICPVRTSADSDPEKGITLLIIDRKSPGLTVTPLLSIASDHQNEIILDNVSVPISNMLGKTNEGWPAIQKLLTQSITAKCAEALGSVSWVLEASVTYAKQRVQYDKPIGSFGIIQHYLADMWTNVNTARRFLYYVTWLIDSQIPCQQEVSMLKASVNEIYKNWTRMGIQIHGAIGTTRESDVGLHYRKARQFTSLFGDTGYHLEKVAKEISSASSWRPDNGKF